MVTKSVVANEAKWETAWPYVYVGTAANLMNIEIGSLVSCINYTLLVSLDRREEIWVGVEDGVAIVLSSEVNIDYDGVDITPLIPAVVCKFERHIGYINVNCLRNISQ